MKNQNYGCTPPMIPWLRHVSNCMIPHAPRDGAIANYKASRQNGDKEDEPNWDFPEDGTGYWEAVQEKIQPCCYGEASTIQLFRYRYDAGDGDAKWMKARDYNYIQRLQSKETLTELEQQDLKAWQDKTEDTNSMAMAMVR